MIRIMMMIIILIPIIIIIAEHEAHISEENVVIYLSKEFG